MLEMLLEANITLTENPHIQQKTCDGLLLAFKMHSLTFLHLYCEGVYTEFTVADGRKA